MNRKLRRVETCRECKGAGTLYVDPSSDPLDGIGAYDCGRCEGTGLVVVDG